MGIVICTEKSCECIHDGKNVDISKMWDKDYLLPCGHKPSQIVMGASVLRDAAAAEEKLQKIETVDFCEHCLERSDCLCDGNPFGDDCLEHLQYAT